MDFAQNTWPSVITESADPILIGKILRVTGPQPAGSGQQQGTAVVQVMKEITHSRWHGPPEITVAFVQLASWQSRLREGDDGWNGVNIKPGVTLLMGLPSAPALGNGSPVSLEAVSQIESPGDSLVSAVSQALHIEQTTALQQRLPLLRQALNSDLPVLESYAHFALGRKHRVPRVEAAALEIALMLDSTKEDTRRLAAESTLALELWLNGDPHDATNRSIVAALLRVFTREEPGLQRSTLINVNRLLFSFAPQDPADADTYRSALLSNQQSQPETIQKAAQAAAQTDPNVRIEAEQLIHLFAQPHQ
jgi:hypothetical protein